jgi:hypothetical protein
LLFESGLNLYGLNINTLSSYLIGYIGYGASGDLTWYDDDLYMTTPLIKIVLNSSNTAIVSVTPISLSVPSCEGAVTASFAGDYNHIVGFNGPNLIKVCQIDGTYQTLCANLNIGGTPGGASIRLATQVPQPTACSTTGIQNVFSNNLISIFPNPTSNELNIQTNHNQPSEIILYDILSRKLLHQTFTNSVSLNTEQLQKGIYIYELRDKKGVIKKGKVVKD